jgi:hypothetical protein
MVTVQQVRFGPHDEGQPVSVTPRLLPAFELQKNAWVKA